ncbi:MAG: hydroxylamine reductase, partial [Oscillospiraceae bacterium]|nr:hydroxylamine reductase [Oscillospiraceae bacterium]
MFCFQCEQTAKCTACTGSTGVCGKPAEVADIQDRLTGAMIGLARATDGNEGLVTDVTDKLIIDGLFATLSNVNFDGDFLTALTDRIHAEKERIVPQCGGCDTECGRNDDYDMSKLWNADEDIRSLKSLILFGIRGVAAYAFHAAALGRIDKDVTRFFYKALNAIGDELGADELLPIVLEVGETNLKCMALLDEANTTAFGVPSPTEVSHRVEKGPFIVVTGHDLLDLKELLEQTEGKGINVYTHGEMLPAHAYPELKKFKHLKGNFGT